MTYEELKEEARSAKEDVWELLDRKLNRLCASDISVETLKDTFSGQHDKLTMLCVMLTNCLSAGHMQSTVLEGKLARAIEALRLLSLQSSAAPSQLTETTLSLNTDAQAPIDVDAFIDVDAIVEPEDRPRARIEEAIDVDALEDLPVATRASVAKSSRPLIIRKIYLYCPGFRVILEAGQNPYTIYPWAMHMVYEMPWDIYILRDVLFLRSRNCNDAVPDDQECCATCSRLIRNNVLKGILKRMKEGVHENSPHYIQPIGGLLQVIERKDLRCDRERHKGLNRDRALLVRNRQLADSKRFVLAVASGKVSRVSALVRTGVNRGASVKAMLVSFEKAAEGLYKPKNIQEKEVLLGWLLWKFGGPRCAGIANRALGLPSVSTVRVRMKTERLVISVLIPSVTEVVTNINRMFSSDLVRSDASVAKRGTTGSKGYGYVLQFDEIACERRIRYDPASNKILGLARETALNTPQEFTSIDDAHQLYEDLVSGQAEMASEVTVIALGAVAPETRVYAGRPIGLSGTCKTEDGETHAKLIENAILACGEAKDKIGGYIMCIASDGESRRGLSFNILTMQAPLAEISPIYPLLRPLQLLDLMVGQNDLTGDKDYKHVFKRYRNLLLRGKGLYVDGVFINRDILGEQLRADRLSPMRIRELLKPDDKQDVVLAYNLLKTIAHLRSPNTNDSAGFIRTRAALNILGKLFENLIAPYTSIDMTLAEQLNRLSTAAHMALALYTQNDTRGKLMPVQLYTDTMIMIKNVFFCVAKMKVYEPKGKFFLILMGTDRLETLFGIVRTISGNDSNPDLMQLGWRLSDSGTAAEILAAYPEWDRSPRRLTLPPFTQPGEVRQSADHINPGSWRGDIYVANATPLTGWREGRRRAGDLLKTLQTPITWNKFYANDKINILQPFGATLLQRTGEIPAEDDETREGLDENHVLPPLETSPTHDALSREEIDLEDLAGVEDESLEKRKTHVTVNGKQINKARVLREWFRHFSTAASTDRLKRVAQISRYSTSAPAAASIPDGDSVFGIPNLSINDPVATLVSVNDVIFLAVGHVTSIKKGQARLESIDLELLRENSVSVTIQILQIKPDERSNATSRTDWSWTSQFEQSITTPGRFVQPINPPTTNVFPPTYLFRSDELRATAALIHDNLAPGDIKQLPKVKQTETFPYRSSEGEACFNITTVTIALLPRILTGRMDRKSSGTWVPTSCMIPVSTDQYRVAGAV
ncbi:hypothetical protein SISSUDRAFT_1067790 [Sistotremastrum suecicum HHB10207 ss-3]|uniref:Uncharacterized protein n=1 Tax=Sistotremastrum suecicum HHB10207 ss-3 TaxID=1314776 RepID=A0A165WPK1_9AGAM|nr:hypothetical protein SISSUDRAFT_1067790 [Sistotremastrum suecicum HHB10207 ss-3]